MDIEKWVDIAKECKYLPENDLKVLYGLLMWAEIFPILCRSLWNTVIHFRKVVTRKISRRCRSRSSQTLVWILETFEHVLTRSRFKELIFSANNLNSRNYLAVANNYRQCSPVSILCTRPTFSFYNYALWSHQPLPESSSLFCMRAKLVLLAKNNYSYGVFPLPDSDSYADSDSNANGCSNANDCFHWTYTDSYSDPNGYCTHFDTDMDTDKVEFE